MGTRSARKPRSGAAWLALTLGFGAALVASARGQQCGLNELQKLLADDAAGIDLFGISVSINGDRVVVGAVRDDDSGSASVFRRDGTAWVQESKLTAQDAGEDDGFGNAVSLSDDRAVVGAWGDWEAGVRSGSAYVFRREGVVWVQEAKLTAEDGDLGSYFGVSVSISAEHAIVGAYQDREGGFFSGSAYVFRREGTTWVQEVKLKASDAATGDFFGVSVSIDNDRAIVGARGDDDAADRSGSAYVFRRDGTTWIEEAKLTASDPVVSALFGDSVSISGDRAVVGARGSDSVYVFRRAGTTWIEEAKLTASDAGGFGGSVSITDTHIVVGALSDDDAGLSSGAAYIFRRQGTMWAQGVKMRASDAAAVDRFGSSVSISGDRAIVGAPNDDDAGESSGSAYMFAVGDCNGELDACEECDGGLGCTDCLCDAGFEPTAPPSLDCQPTCGNGTVDPGEECDGMDDTFCPGACLSNCTCGPFCGDGVCDPNEDSCNCPDDCGTPAQSETPGSTCSDRLDNDCDGDVDCDDPDCDDEPDCEGVPTVSQWGMAVLLLALLAGIALKFRRSRTT